MKTSLPLQQAISNPPNHEEFLLKKGGTMSTERHLQQPGQLYKECAQVPSLGQLTEFRTVSP